MKVRFIDIGDGEEKEIQVEDVNGFVDLMKKMSGFDLDSDGYRLNDIRFDVDEETVKIWLEKEINPLADTSES